MSNNLNKQEELKTEFEAGIVNDLFWAQYSFFVYRLIGENSEQLNSALKSGSELRRQINYHQTTSRLHCILQLAKVFEKRDKSYPNRCFLRLFADLRNQSDVFDSNLNETDDIKLLRTFIAGNKRNMTIDSAKSLIGLMNKALNSEAIKLSVSNLMRVRHKVIAHNEKLASTHIYQNFWKDFEFLLRFARLLRNVTGFNLFHTSYNGSHSIGDEVVDPDFRIDLYWIAKQVEDIVGKERLIFTLPKWSFIDEANKKGD